LNNSALQQPKKPGFVGLIRKTLWPLASQSGHHRPWRPNQPEVWTSRVQILAPSLGALAHLRPQHLPQHLLLGPSPTNPANWGPSYSPNWHNPDPQLKPRLWKTEPMGASNAQLKPARAPPFGPSGSL